MKNINFQKRQRLRNRVVISVRFYEKHLVNKKFVIFTEDNSIYIILFKKEDFLHLTGLDVNTDRKSFYELCNNQKLSVNNILSNQKYNFKTLLGKSLSLLKIDHFMHTNASTNLFLIDLVTNTETFPVAIRNDLEDMTIAFKGKDLHARSLRKAKNSKNCTKQLLIYAIFQIEENDTLASSIVYLKDAETILTNFKDLDKYVNQELIIDLKERLKKKTQR